jgi:hypothetical protein
MQRKILLILLAVAMVFLVGCRGTRTVQVYVDCAYPWAASMTLDNGTSTNTTGNSNASYDLGNTNSNVTISASMVPGTLTTGSLTLRIVENYDAGFLYQASTDTKASVSTASMGTVITAAYDFSTK